MSRDDVLVKLAAHFDAGPFLDDVARRVTIRTESQVPASRALLGEYLAKQIGPALEQLDYETAIIGNPQSGGGPFLLARRIEDSNLPTVLTYGHADVVRGLDGQWREGLDPWTLTREGERLYGRGIADNKGQHSIHLAALAAVIAVRGRLGFNSIFLMETGEEIGSPGLDPFCRQHREALGADVLISSDGPRLAPDRPTLFMGSRGAMSIDFELELRPGSHHSGNWGGLLANPGTILANAIASIVDKTGRILVRELVPRSIPDTVRKALEDCDVDSGKAAPEVDDWWGEPGLSRAEKVFGWNTFEVLAFETGSPAHPVNAIPPRATARCQIRYTVDSDPVSFIAALRAHLDALGFEAVRVAEAEVGSCRATRTDPNHPWVRWTAASVERTLGVRPALLPNLGGSLPNSVFADMMGLPTIWVPHSYSGCSQHAPNEHALVPLLREGLLMMGGIFWDMGEDPAPFSRASV